MNATQIIEEIDAMTSDEQSKVIAHLQQLKEMQYHEEQVRVSEQRLDDLDNGLEEEIPYEQVKEILIKRQ